jgi:pimeloyl-ACP methyl ester carboxylesterase
MTIVLVHGNPEVSSIWDAMIAELGRDDVVTLSPPGFGGAMPPGFGSTYPEYAQWLVGELAGIPGPVHLIGHDWGGVHVVFALLLDPGLAASVTTDIAGCFAPGYVWHDAARTWRTPGAGERAIADAASRPVDDIIDVYTALGMTPHAAAECARAAGEMGPSILALYRSADESVLQRAGTEVAALEQRPDLHVIVPTGDPYTGGADRAAFTAQAWDATTHRLDGLGHWWMMEDPARAAEVVRAIAG